MKKIFPLTFIFILLLSTNSCTITKRQFQPGFHISWHKNIGNNSKLVTLVKYAKTEKNKSDQFENTPFEEENTLHNSEYPASTSESNEFINEQFSRNDNIDKQLTKSKINQKGDDDYENVVYENVVYENDISLIPKEKKEKKREMPLWISIPLFLLGGFGVYMTSGLFFIIVGLIFSGTAVSGVLIFVILLTLFFSFMYGYAWEYFKIFLKKEPTWSELKMKIMRNLLAFFTACGFTFLAYLGLSEFFI